MPKSRVVAVCLSLALVVGLAQATTVDAAADTHAVVSDWAYDPATDTSSATLALNARQAGTCAKTCVIAVEVGHQRSDGTWVGDASVYRETHYASEFGAPPWSLSEVRTVSGPARYWQRATHYRVHELRDEYPPADVGWVEFRDAEPATTANLSVEKWEFDETTARVSYSLRAGFQRVQSPTGPCSTSDYCSLSVVVGVEQQDGSVHTIQALDSSTDYASRFAWNHEVRVARDGAPDLEVMTHVRAVQSSRSGGEVASPWVRLPRNEDPPSVQLQIDTWKFDETARLVDYSLTATYDKTFSVAGHCRSFCTDSIEAGYQNADGTWHTLHLSGGGHSGRYPWRFTTTAARQAASGFERVTHVRAVMEPLYNNDPSRVLSTGWQPLEVAGLRTAELGQLVAGVGPLAFCDALVFAPRPPTVELSTVNREVQQCYAGARAGLSTRALVALLTATPAGAGLVWWWVHQHGYAPPATPGEDPEAPPGPPPTPPAPLPPAGGAPAFDEVANVDALAQRLINDNAKVETALSDDQWKVVARQCLWSAASAALSARSSCEDQPIFISGRDYPQVTDHAIEALTGVAPQNNSVSQHWQLPPADGNLHPPTQAYTLSPIAATPGWVQQNWEGGEAASKPGRGWYAIPFQGYAHPQCSPIANHDCDEFPNFAVEQGGRPAERTPHMKMIDANQNRDHGRKFYDGVRECGLSAGQPPPDRRLQNSTGGTRFLYIPVPDQSTFFLPSLWVCNEAVE